MNHPENKWNEPIKDPDLVFRSIDHPEANGRTPVPGDQIYTIGVDLEDGRHLHLKMGRNSFDNFRGMLEQMDADDKFEDFMKDNDVAN
jgi:hypothetical protein